MTCATREGSAQRETVRIEESAAELERLRREFGTWRAQREQADLHGRHATQLGALEELVTRCLDMLRVELERAPRAGREVHDRCRVVDRQVVFVRRLWSYFREKWSQRDDYLLGPVLAAADEIVWSCYAPPFRRLDRDPGPPPLPFVDDDHSPYAIPLAYLPVQLRSSDELLRRTLDELPVPVIGIPPVCVSRPWWLVAIAHEVGHQLAYAFDAAPGQAARNAIETAAASTGTGAQDLWGSWTHELLADAYAIAAIGGAHHRALVAFEHGGDATMTRFVDRYPPPIVRQAFAASVLAELGLAAELASPPLAAAVELDEIELERDELAYLAALLKDVPAVAGALVRTPLVEDVTLAGATAFDEKRLSGDGEVDWWARQLLKDTPLPVSETLTGARLATAGALTAWTRVAEEPGVERRAARAEALRSRTLAAASANRDEGQREDAGASVFDADALAERVLRGVAELPDLDQSGPSRFAAGRGGG